MLRERAILELKRVLTRIGAHLSMLHYSRVVQDCELYGVRAMDGRPWLQCVELGVHLRREDFFARVANEVGDSPVLFMEFGVYRGESIRVWSRLLRHPETRPLRLRQLRGTARDFPYAETAKILRCSEASSLKLMTRECLCRLYFANGEEVRTRCGA